MRKKTVISVTGAVIVLCLALPGCNKKEESLSAPAAVSQTAEFDFSVFSDLKRAALKITRDGETREETAANKEDLEKLSQELFAAEKASAPPEGWDGLLTLETEDQKVITVNVFFGDRWLLGTENGAAYQLPEESEDVIWGMFSTLEGWVTYGSQVRIEMAERTVKLNADELVMTLHNDTGGPIEYIASPILYRQMEDGTFRQVESIGGFCGFVSNLDGKEALVKIPWRGMFEAAEPGVYKVEIQAMKEEVRWEIWDTFNLAD